MTGMPSAQASHRPAPKPNGASNGNAANGCGPCTNGGMNSDTDGSRKSVGDPAVARMTSLVDRLGRAVHCLQFADGLNPAQWAVLRYLDRANRYSRTPTAISEYLGTTRGTVSQTIKALEAKGMIRRAASGRDRRAVLLELTGEGRVALEDDPLHCVASVAGMLGDELDEASRFLDRVVDCLQAGNGSLGFGMCADCTHFCRNGFGGESHRCGLTGDPLSAVDSTKICVNYSAPSAP